MRRATTGKRTSQKESGSWLATYGDLMTLLVCFFVMLASLSAVESSKFKKALASIRGALGAMPKDMFIPEQVPMDLTDVQRMLILKTLQGLSRFISDRGLDDVIRLKLTSKGLALQISNPLLFELGNAELKPEILPMMKKIVSLTREWPHWISVEGHTDDLPIHTRRYPSNWELSSARALSVVKYFVTQGSNPAKLSAVGYGEFRPMVPNDSAEHQAMNRRVEILIEYDRKAGQTIEIETDWTGTLLSEETDDGEQ